MPSTDTIAINEEYIALQGEGDYIGVLSHFIRLQGCNLSCEWCDSAYTWDGSEKGEKTAIGDVVKLVNGGPTKHVVFTGGEPMLQWSALKPIIEKLWVLGSYSIQIETNGTKPVSTRDITCMMGHSMEWQWPAHDAQIVWSISPKLQFMKDQAIELSALMSRWHISLQAEVTRFWQRKHGTRLRHYFKFPVRADTENHAREDILPIVSAMRSSSGGSRRARVFLMPITSPDDSLEDLTSQLRVLESLVMGEFATPSLGISPRVHTLMHGHKRGV